MSEHTPGPWSLFAFTEPFNSATGVRSGWHVNGAGAGFVETLWCRDHRAAECEANARLIAVAPRMFAVIEKGAAAGDAECIAIVDAVVGEQQ